MLVIREALRAIRRTPFPALAAATTLALSFGLIGILAILAQQATKELERSSALLYIEAFFKPEIGSSSAEQKAASLTKTPVIKAAIRSSSFVSKEVALTEYQRVTGEDVLSVLEENPLPASLKLFPDNVSSRSVEKLVEELRRTGEFSDVVAGTENLRVLERRALTLRTLTIVVGSLLLFAAIALVMTTLRLAVEGRKDAIYAMKLLGATRFQTHTPFILEGVLAGLTGGLLGGGLLLLLLNLITTLSPGALEFRLADREIVLGLGVLTVLGGGVAAITSYFSTVRLISRVGILRTEV